MKRRRNSKLKFEEPSDQSPTTTADFTFTLTRIAVGQICQSIGYKATDSSALNTLTVTTTKFLQSLAGLASSFSNAANRTESNLFDVVNGLQDIALSTSDCFPGGSTVHDVESHCLIKSAVVRNLSDFVKYAPEIPFAKPLPRPERDGSSSGRDLDHEAVTVTRSVEYVPAWLPPFPDASLYSDRCTKDGSDHLWENSVTVIDRENLMDSLKSESCRGRKSGRLPQRRARVRFKMERDCSDGDTRWRRDNDGESGCDIEVKKRILEEYIHSAGEWPI